MAKISAVTGNTNPREGRPVSSSAAAAIPSMSAAMDTVLAMNNSRKHSQSTHLG